MQVISPLGTAVSRTPFKVTNCVNPLPGLESWWTGDGHARDSLGRHPGGARETAFAPGVDAYAFSLDGSRSFVSIAHRPTLNFGAADFTVGFWMRTSAVGARAVLNKRAACATGSGFWDIRLTLDGRMEAELTGDGSFIYAVISAAPVNDGTWRHVALVRQGATARLYIDGQAQGFVDTKEVLNIGNTAPWRIGSDPCIGADRTRFYQGMLDEVQWFSQALSAAEIKSIIGARESGVCRP